ncbi:unnamed protein product (macronuclear) [Paramecium tetraurelia]|uniref:Uncharacterized protein n=1 Tax=Paramecium tetraurelia TaxID=5888 RepID=A0CQQ6_PARTE|nr:uncharacterized protein GSPATT00009471001 [Paramecium tetraurelia]CAK73123.1 unnamed protein product [Paramecium tetraurelia]|eukprot:XP_001440520.1 hypothetical protein (macronuclear) [Paramecium tetraurelia strain d4-2]
MKVNTHKNEIAANDKVLKDIELYEKIFLSTKYENKKQQSLEIRRLLPNIQYSQHQQSTLSSQQIITTQFDQDTSYTNRNQQDVRKKQIHFSLIDCSKFLKSSNSTHYVQSKKQTSPLKQKIVIVNHQGRPLTYFI